MIILPEAMCALKQLFTSENYNISPESAQEGNVNCKIRFLQLFVNKIFR